MTNEPDEKTGPEDQISRARASIRDVPTLALAAKIRAVMPDILARLDDGAHYQDIVEALARVGIKINKRTLITYVYRYRSVIKKKGRNYSVNTAKPIERTHESNLAEATSPNSTISDEEFEDLFDPRKQEEFANQYIKRRPNIFAKRGK